MKEINDILYETVFSRVKEKGVIGFSWRGVDEQWKERHGDWTKTHRIDYEHDLRLYVRQMTGGMSRQIITKENINDMMWSDNMIDGCIHDDPRD